jgi:hypothetical protein
MSRPSILICLPTVPMRQPYLANACMGFATRTEADFNLSIVTDADCAGTGWNRCAEQGLEWFPETTHIHFGNDDVVCATGWDGPLIEACDAGCVPCPRIEPAGGHIRDRQIFQTHPPMPPDYYPVPRDQNAYFYADIPSKQPTVDGQEIPHGNLPTMSREVWERVKPYPPIHYGTDAYVYERARKLGYPVVAKLDSVFFNFNANIFRSKIVDGVEWTEQDFLDWDGVFSLPKYQRGELRPDEPDPLRLTPEGLRMARAWREATFHSDGTPR